MIFEVQTFFLQHEAKLFEPHRLPSLIFSPTFFNSVLKLMAEN